MISVVYWCKLYVKTRTNFDAFQCIISKSSCAAAHQYTIIFTSMLFVGSLFNTIRYIIWVTWIGIIKKKHFYVGQETYLLLHDKITAHFLSFTNPWDEMMLINSSGMTIPETALYVVFQILYLKNEHEVYFADNPDNEHIYIFPWYNKQLHSIPWFSCFPPVLIHIRRERTCAIYFSNTILIGFIVVKIYVFDRFLSLFLWTSC